MMRTAKGTKEQISIVIPAYNEEARLPARLEEIITFLKDKKLDYEIIIIDDGSTDKTLEIAKKTAKKDKRIRILENDRNRGKGYSVKRGMLAAKKELALFTDSDKSTPIAELSQAMPLMKEYDVVIGSRALKSSNVVIKQPFHKALLGKAGNLLIRLMATPGIHDTQCGFKLFSKRSREVFSKQTIDRWGFDFEILFIAKKMGLSIKEMPVVWVNDERSKVKPSDYLRVLAELLKIRWNDLRGEYD